jgi:hypothetical protein
MAFDFNGTNQYLSVNSAVVSAVPMTFACWAMPDAGASSSSMVSLGSSLSLFPLVQMRLRWDLNTTEAAIRSDANETGVATGPSFTAGSFQHFSSVFASTTSRTMYVNGVAGTANTTTVGAMTMDLTGIATAIRAAPTAFFDGKIAEVGIWNVALTADEITSLAKGMTCNQIRPQSLVFYAPIVRDLQDIKAGRTITNNNSATVSTHPRIYS